MIMQIFNELLCGKWAGGSQEWEQVAGQEVTEEILAEDDFASGSGQIMDLL